MPGKPECHCLANADHKAARTLDALSSNISVAVKRGTCTEATCSCLGREGLRTLPMQG